MPYPKLLTKHPFGPHSSVCHMKQRFPCPSSGGNQSTRPPLHSSPRHPAFSRSSVSIVSLRPPLDLHFLTWGVCDIPGAIIRGFHSLFPEGIRYRSFSEGLEMGVREPVWTRRPLRVSGTAAWRGAEGMKNELLQRPPGLRQRGRTPVCIHCPAVCARAPLFSLGGLFSSS